MESFKLRMSSGGLSANRDNNLTVVRPNYRDAALMASKDEGFISRIRAPLNVSFLNEEGIDGGGVRRDFFTNLFQAYESVIFADRTAFGMTATEVEEDDYAAGLFSSLAIIQEGMYLPFMITALQRGSTSFHSGMNLLGVADVSYKIYL